MFYCDDNFGDAKLSISSVCLVLYGCIVETKLKLTLFWTVIETRLTRELRLSSPGCQIIARWLRDQHLALPRVRTGLLIWLGGLAPCTLTALTTNWYSVSGNNPFKTMELVSMGSRMYVHSVSISGLWNDKITCLGFVFWQHVYCGWWYDFAGILLLVFLQSL